MDDLTTPLVNCDKSKTHRPGSRAWQLLRLKHGESLFLHAPPGRLTQFMQQIGVDIRRIGMGKQLSQRLLIAVEPASRRVYDIVRITREDQP